MSQFDVITENKERGPKHILAIEPNPEVANLYKTWFKRNMNMPVEVVEASSAVINKKENVGLIIVEPREEINIGDYILKLRKVYPEQPIVVASQRNDILSDIKDAGRFPNVSALTKPFPMQELGELVDALEGRLNVDKTPHKEH